MINKKIKRFLLVLIIFKFVCITLYYFCPPVHPHITRQVDTMSVTFRYWLRWTLEEHPKYSLIPAYLSTGESYGLQFMEFPLLNLILAPLFAFGVEAGRVLNNFGLLLINLGLTYWAWSKWKGTEIKGQLVDDAFLLFPLISAASFFFYKQIPDYTAAILVTLSLGYSFNESKKNFFMSFSLLAIGVLVKPPQVIALAPLLLHSNRKYILKSMVWIIPAAIPCLLYYTLGNKMISELRDGPSFFGTHIRDPLYSFLDVLYHPKELFQLYLESFFGRYVAVPVMIYYIYNAIKTKNLKISPIAVLIVLQMIALIFLDGSHLFIHNYYLCGMIFTASLLFLNFLNTAPKTLSILAIVIITVNIVDRGIYESRSLFKDNIYKQCRDLKARNPDLPWDEDFVFSSTKPVPPTLGLCFGVRQDSQKSNFGFYFDHQKVPARCKQIDRSKDIILTKCNS